MWHMARPTGYEADMGGAIASALGELLTKKHLYQSVVLPFDLGSFHKASIDLHSAMERRFGATEQLHYLEGS
jgi:hypothetical protein